ncbi:MAG: dTMP kinase, partial [Corynebacterium flavescens]|nr:dTMP kinase [Corynebacterium flavescens]
FALDRYGAKEKLLQAAESSCLLILDRYVASNAAYSMARLGDDGVADWVYDLEYGRLGLPKPDLQIFLDTDVELAASRARGREAADDTRERDQYEKDSNLQSRTAAAYRRLAQADWAGQWIATAEVDMIVRALKDRLGV